MEIEEIKVEAVPNGVDWICSNPFSSSIFLKTKDKDTHLSWNFTLDVINPWEIRDIIIDTEEVKIKKYKAAPEKHDCKRVRVLYSDGTEVKAVCMPGDEFDLKEGLRVCLLKRYAQVLERNMEKDIRGLEKRYKELEKKKAEEKEVERIIANRKEKKKRRDEKRAEKKRLEEIDKESEVMFLAMKKLEDYKKERGM